MIELVNKILKKKEFYIQCKYPTHVQRPKNMCDTPINLVAVFIGKRRTKKTLVHESIVTVGDIQSGFGHGVFIWHFKQKR